MFMTLRCNARICLKRTFLVSGHRTMGAAVLSWKEQCVWFMEDTGQSESFGE